MGCTFGHLFVFNFSFQVLQIADAPRDPTWALHGNEWRLVAADSHVSFLVFQFFIDRLINESLFRSISPPGHGLIHVVPGATGTGRPK